MVYLYLPRLFDFHSFSESLFIVAFNTNSETTADRNCISAIITRLIVDVNPRSVERKFLEG